MVCFVTQLLRKQNTHLCIVTKLIMELLKLAPITLAGHYIEVLAVSVSPVTLLLINGMQKRGATVRPWNKNTGLWRVKGFHLPVLEGP